MGHIRHSATSVFRTSGSDTEYSLKRTFRCPMVVSQPGRDLAWAPLGNDSSLSTWRRLLLFSRISAGRKPDSAITTPRLVVRLSPSLAGSPAFGARRTVGFYCCSQGINTRTFRSGRSAIIVQQEYDQARGRKVVQTPQDHCLPGCR